MKTIFYSILFFVFIFSSCGSKKVDKRQILKSSIDSIENILFKKASTEPIDLSLGALAVKAYINYVDNFANDSIASSYLFKAAEVSNTIKKYNEAVSYFERFEITYPDNTKAPVALFLQAFICENNLSELGRAHNLYEKVVSKYPNTQFAKDAEVCINNLGKSPDDLIKEFEEKNKSSNQ